MPPSPIPQEPRSQPLDFLDTSLLLLHEDVGASYDAVAQSAAAAVGAQVCHLALYDPDTQEIVARRPHYGATARAVPQYRFPVAAAPASAHVLATGEAYVSNDPASDPLYEPTVRDRGVRSVLTVPIRRGDLTLGFLYALNKPGGFVADDARTLTALAGAAAVTLENIRLYAKEREQRVLNESLSEVSRALIGNLSEDAALASVLDQMWKVVRYQAALAVLLEGSRLRVAASRGGDPDFEIPLEDAGDLGAALESRQLAILSDAATRLPRLGLRGVTGRALAAPLLARGDVRGALIVVFEPDHLPGLRDGQMVSAFADHLALFLEAGSRLRREQQGRSRAAALARLTRVTASRHEPESLLQAVAPEVLALSGADRAVFYLKHPRTWVMTPVAWAGVRAEEQGRVEDLRFDLVSGPLAALRAGEPVTFEGDSYPGAYTPFPNASCQLLLPLATHETIGVLSLVSRRPRFFEAALVDFLADVARQVALGVENARLFAALSQMASTDELTQLANRRRFSESLRAEMARSRRTGLPLSLVLADVDHLKRVNDTFGHPAGDAAIRHVAQAMRDGRRENDVVARLGGEEFAVLLPAAEHAGAVQAAERVRRMLSSSEVSPAGVVTASMGVATFPQDAGDEERLVWVADQRLYAAKEGGRNRVCAAASSEPATTPVFPGE